MLEEPEADRWEAWRPADVARRLAGVEAPWWVAGGWALDLWKGAQTRVHEDLEICVPRSEWSAVRERLADHDLWCAGGGRFLALAPGEPAPATRRQVWVRDRARGVWRLDVMLDAGDRTTWVCHRDPGLRRPIAEAVGRTPGGIPYLRPEIVLLLKAKATRSKDRADFDGFLPLLDDPARRWLGAALATQHPGHPWLERV